MHRVDTSTAAANLPAAETPGTPGYFSKGDPQSGAVPTTPGQDWFNMIQEELIAILVAFGVTPDATKADYGQIADALLANFANILGNASQRFRVADAVENNEAPNLGQMLAAAGGLKSVQVITVSGTWNKPVGVKYALVWNIGPGGGSSGFDTNSGGCGGGGGGTAIKFIDVAAIESETVTIGQGGTAGGSGDAGAGGDGGTTSFGSHCSATGGKGGVKASQTHIARGGNGVGGDINIEGHPGKYPAASQGSQGGGTFLSGGTTGPYSQNETAHAGTGNGAGASGGFNNSTPGTGAVGANGVVIVWEYK